MIIPDWILDIFAALMLVVAAVSAARLVTAWRQRGPVTADVDVAHLLTGIAMAGSLTAALATLPHPAWEGLFGLTTAWFAWRVWRDARASGVRALVGGHCAPHLVHGGAMLYMFLALAASADSPAMGGVGGTAGVSMGILEYPTLAFAFALILAGYSVWDLDQLSGKRYSLTSVALQLVPASVPAIAAVESSAAPAPVRPSAGDPARMEASPAGEAVPRESAESLPALSAVLLSPGTTVGCRIVMGVTMAFMLVIMI
jgi:hypothetical protein